MDDFKTLTKYADWFGKISNGGWKNAVCLEGGSYGYGNIRQKPTNTNKKQRIKMIFFKSKKYYNKRIATYITVGCKCHSMDTISYGGLAVYR